MPLAEWSLIFFDQDEEPAQGLMPRWKYKPDRSYRKMNWCASMCLMQCREG